MCNTWVHQVCLHMADEEFQTLTSPEVEWYCARCRQVKANKIKWGEHVGEENIRNVVTTTYETLVGWKKNIFRLPRGKCGSDFIKELTRLINLFVDKTPWERLALSLVHIYVPIMLQLPSPKSKPREQAKYLTSRLERWKSGDIKSLMDETAEIQRRLKPRKSEGDRTEENQKSFVKLMLLGKIGDAAKKVNNEDTIKGVHTSVMKYRTYYNKNILWGDLQPQRFFYFLPAIHHNQLYLKLSQRIWCTGQLNV